MRVTRHDLEEAFSSLGVDSALYRVDLWGGDRTGNAARMRVSHIRHKVIADVELRGTFRDCLERALAILNQRIEEEQGSA